MKKVESLLTAIRDLLDRGIIERASGSSNTITSTAATSGSTITAGAKAVSVVFSSDFVGTFNGIARPASSAVNLGATLGKTLPAIAYTVSAGTAYIDVTT